MTGRDPRRMSADQLEAMGHLRMSAQEALRLKCLDCCAGNTTEVRLCVAVTCPSWPFRMGKNPWRSAPSDDRLAAMRERGRRLAAARSEADKSLPPAMGTGSAATPVPDRPSGTARRA